MLDINDVLADNRAAVHDLAAAAERSAATWTTATAPRKWSPSQILHTRHHGKQMPGGGQDRFGLWRYV